MALSNEKRIELCIDEALSYKRHQLSKWEIKFLNGLRSGYWKYSQLTVKQKTVVRPILKRLKLLPPSPKFPM